MSRDQHLAELIAAHSAGRDVNQPKLLAFLSPLFTRCQHAPLLSSAQLSAYESFTREEREVLIRCLECLRNEVAEAVSWIH